MSCSSPRSTETSESRNDEVVHRIAQARAITASLQLRRAQRLHLQLLDRHCVGAALGAWKLVLDWAPQRRREALFEAMHAQLLDAKLRYKTAEQGMEKLVRILTTRRNSSSLKSLLRVWRFVSILHKRCQKLTYAWQHDSIRRDVALVFTEWLHQTVGCRMHANFHTVSIAEGGVARMLAEGGAAQRQQDASSSNALLENLSTSPTLTPSNHDSHCCRLARSQSMPGNQLGPGHPALEEQVPVTRRLGNSTTHSFQPPQRVPFAVLPGSGNVQVAVGREGDHKRLKGPERFFYDVSGYTGCARFGGPEVVDKKENRIVSQRQWTMKPRIGNLNPFNTIQMTGRRQPWLPR